MAAFPFSDESLRVLKQALQDEYPSIKSSHLTEALAAALGFRTHAAVLASLQLAQSQLLPLLNAKRFVQRLSELGYENINPPPFSALIRGIQLKKHGVDLPEVHIRIHSRTCVGDGISPEAFREHLERIVVPGACTFRVSITPLSEGRDAYYPGGVSDAGGTCSEATLRMAYNLAQHVFGLLRQASFKKA